MLDTLIELIPILKNSLLNDREKRLVLIAVLISFPITIFLISFAVTYIVMETNVQKQLEESAAEHSKKIFIPHRTVKYNKTEKEALYLLLSKAFNEGNFNYAEEISKDLISNDSTDNFVKYIAAKIKIENKKYAEANEILQNLKAKNYMPDSVKTLLISVISFNDLPEIIADTNSLSALQLAKIGERYLPENEKSANIFFEKALKKDSTNIEALLQAARWNMNDKNYKSAEKLLLKALEIDSLSARVSGRYAMLLHETGRANYALLYYKKAIEKNPYDFNLAFNLGELYLSSFNDGENAEIYFKRAVELSPKIWQSYFKLGLISLEKNNFAEAVNYFMKAEENSADNPRILHLLAVTYEKSGDNTNAVLIYEKILNKNPFDDIAIYKNRLLKQKL